MGKYTVKIMGWTSIKEIKCNTEKEVWNAIGSTWSPYEVFYTETGESVAEFIPL